MRVERFEFKGGGGEALAARLDLPDARPRAYALFAHCFTCTKDSHAAARISAALAQKGVAVLRFDFTGLGESEGDFSSTDFSSNVADLKAAIAHMAETARPPQILIGHSLGGAAVLAAAEAAPDARAVVTIGAPCEASHVISNFGDRLADIERDGRAEVDLAGRRFTLRKDFIDDAKAQPQKARIADLRKALLVMHSPTDAVVDIDNARMIFDAARHPKSFVSLDGADHLLSDPADAAYVADVIACWSQRYLPALAEDAAPAAPAPVGGAVLVEETGQGKFEQCVVTADGLRVLADEPAAVGGGGAGPGPYDLLLAALGACTSMTVRLYADRKAIPLERTRVILRHRRAYTADAAKGAGKMEHIDRQIAFEGDLDEATRTRLLEIADKCPVHRTLSGGVGIHTTAVSAAPVAPMLDGAAALTASPASP